MLHGVTLGIVFVLAPSFLGRGRRRKWWEEVTCGDQVDGGYVGGVAVVGGDGGKGGDGEDGVLFGGGVE